MSYRIIVLSILVLSYLIGCSKDNTTNPQPVIYESVTIGSQVWMIRSLDVDHYRNGDTIPEVKDSVEWINLTTGAWCYYNNDSANVKVYGKLYNWYAVNDPRGLAPAGWNIPSRDEWTTLSTFLGGDSIARSKLKEAGTAHWKCGNTDATNSSGFSALPGGWRDCKKGTFSFVGGTAYWWSATDNYSSDDWYKGLTCIYSPIRLILNFSNNYGFSVRCIQN